MGLLKPATMATAYAKIGIFGEPGSGKTFTGSELAIGLAKASKGKQVAFFDTEKGSDFMIEKFKKQGLELLVHRGRAFADLISVMKEVEDAKIPVLIIDSITHVWRDMCDSYQKKANKKYLSMPDWGILKAQWRDYTDRYVNSNVHALMLGRAGFEYDHQVNEDTGKTDLIKTGTKMKVEGETGYEPDLLLEMLRLNDPNGKITNQCWVVKDRSNTLNGKSFNYPTYVTFESFFKAINIGGAHKGIDTTRNSTALFDDPDWSQVEVQRRRDIALDEIKSEFIKSGLDGASLEAKKGRVAMMEKVFGTSSWTAVENSKVTVLEENLKKLRAELYNGK